MSASHRGKAIDLGMCPCAGATLGRLIQPAIMTILAGGAVHGYRIVQRLARTPMLGGGSPDPTGVYRMLRSMEKRGLVVSSWGLSDSGPAKRLYRLTPAGHRCLGRWVETLTSYRQAIGRLLSAARKAAVTRYARAAGKTRRHR
jgi:DNA-binding PadR family transcriptional regulator